MEYGRPADIERRSLAIITAELVAGGVQLDPANEAVIKRVIHATADYDYVEHLTFTEGAVQRAVAALLQGATIVTDTNMALAGVSRPGLSRLGGQSVCYMADPAVAEEARRLGTTRAVVSVTRAAAEHPGCIYAVGNAPTALYEIVRQMEQGFRPALVVGVPVGFVNVVEAKEAVLAACRERDIPAIASLGRKGGSTVAAAILNALIYQAADMQDPARRGW